MPTEAFWSWARGATAARADAEGWTSSDLFAALLQISLLTYTSHPLSPEIYGPRYSLTSPDHAVHNAPWNDWTPPSKSLERLQEARVHRAPDPITQRVRVRLCSSADALGLEHSVLVFASVNNCDSRGRNLCVRRGATVLASINLDSLRRFRSGGRFIQLMPKAPADATATVFLWFDTDARMFKFSDMIMPTMISGA